MDDLEGKRVLVTGGATGIGGAITRAFAEVGARVTLHYHGGKVAAEALVAGGTAYAAFGGDLARAGDCDAVVRASAEVLGGLDILVNNAGGMVARKPLAEIDDAFIDTVFDLNVRSAVHCCRAALPFLRAAGGGVIINVSSVSAITGGSPGSSIYSGAKGFISTFTRSLARELAPDNIRVNAVSPGTIHTDFHLRHSTPEKLEGTRRTIPMQRLGTAEDCAGTALYLASKKLSGYVTGQVIEVNGGQLMV